jgi:hypothetical protein
VHGTGQRLQSPACELTVHVADHHSEYLAQAVAALTPAGVDRVDELLVQLAQAAGTHEWLVRFAKARRDEADSHAAPALEVEPGRMLTEDELNALTRGFMTIRDTETLDDVADWANAVLALLADERAAAGWG